MAIAESVVEFLLQKLGDLLIQQPIFLNDGVRDQVEWLDTEFKQMQCFLKDADAKQQGDESVKNWMQNVRDVAYDAEDVIDTFVFKIETLKRKRFVGCITRYAFIFHESIALYKAGSAIKQIKNKIRMISENRLSCGIENIGQGVGTSSTSLTLQDCRLFSSDFQEPDFVGFEKELQALVTQLMEGDLRCCIISVVGMGGLGKTTLAEKVYKNTRVRRHFHYCAWISISQEYGVRDLLQAVTKRCMKLSKEELKKMEKMDVIQLRQKLSEYLKKKRYLVVLDDIWTNEAWDAFKDALPDMNNGSRVMITTRNKDIALHADAQSRPHELRFLNREESWELFCMKTFQGQDGSCPQDLEELGRDIVEKCHGLPLAIVVIGGLLSRKELCEWKNVHKSISRHFVERQPQISKILCLSYKDLPYYLKPCFLYLGNFPEDYEFHTKELIRLWSAEGFLQERGEETLEEVGEDYLKELVQRSMIQIKGRSSSGGIKSCGIHDLLRDLSISESKEENFLQVHCGNPNASPSASRARRLAVHHNTLSEFPSLKSSIPSLRSLFIYTQISKTLDRKQDKFLYRGFKLLSVLNLHCVAIKELPSEIGSLIHLRYLSCTKTQLKSLPSSIGNLQNLQTLTVTSNEYVINIPGEVKKMQQLRHLQVKSADDDGPYYVFRGVIQGHPRLDQISNLQTLTCIETGKWIDGCLEKLTNLRKLGICIDLEGAYEEVLYKSIIKLESLESLSVMQYQLSSSEPFTRLLKLTEPFTSLLKLSKLRLEGKLHKLLEFPENLTKLTLVYSSLEQDPLAILEKLNNLRILRLLYHSFNGMEIACSAQGFPRLQTLHLEGLYQLTEWKLEEGAMPSLLHLQMNYCPQLKKLPEGLQHVTTLKKLELWNMHPLFKASLEENDGEDWYKIRLIPSIHITAF